MNDSDSIEPKPGWWEECARIKSSLDLPEYEPPRFEDGVYVHTVVDDLEGSVDGSIRFIGVNTTYPEDWEVRLDGETLFEIGRRRDERGNTVYTMTSDRFRDRVRSCEGERSG